MRGSPAAPLDRRLGLSEKSTTQVPCSACRWELAALPWQRRGQNLPYICCRYHPRATRSRCLCALQCLHKEVCINYTSRDPKQQGINSCGKVASDQNGNKVLRKASQKLIKVGGWRFWKPCNPQWAIRNMPRTSVPLILSGCVVYSPRSSMCLTYCAKNVKHAEPCAH